MVRSASGPAALPTRHSDIIPSSAAPGTLAQNRATGGTPAQVRPRSEAFSSWTTHVASGDCPTRSTQAFLAPTEYIDRTRTAPDPTAPTGLRIGLMPVRYQRQDETVRVGQRPSRSRRPRPVHEIVLMEVLLALRSFEIEPIVANGVPGVTTTLDSGAMPAHSPIDNRTPQQQRSDRDEDEQVLHDHLPMSTRRTILGLGYNRRRRSPGGWGLGGYDERVPPAGASRSLR
jgi:hypothetical protein